MLIDPTIQYKYISLIGSELEGFKEVRHDVFNFRCPICGDSYDNKFKKRGYLLSKNGEFYFYCHNCNTSLQFKKFLQTVNVSLYNEMRNEILKSGKISFTKKEVHVSVPKIEIYKKDVLVNLYDLDDNHPGKQYLLNRKVPLEKLKNVKWTDDFPKLVHDTIGTKYDNSILPKSGIIFELKELDGKVTGYQIRSIDLNIPKNRRFMICSINEDHGFFYDTIDYDKTIYIVEGCTDSLFLDNCIAVLSAALWRLHPSENCVYINDNEPYNESVCKQIQKCIDKNYKVVLLPHMYNNMDVNDLVKNGVSITDLPKLFKQFTFSGLRSKIEFAKWKK